MRVLLTNDDGVHAQGIRSLRNALSEIATVEVIAPDRERSGAGHAITVDTPLRVTRTVMAGDTALAWAVSGTPSDCVKLGLDTILPWQPDFIISGINHGPNLGTDVLYSGTVSAALEGAINGIPALAVSLVSWERGDLFEQSAMMAAHILQQIKKEWVPPGTLLNINLPEREAADFQGIKWTRLGVRRYVNVFTERVDPWGKRYFWLGGEVVDSGRVGDNTDVEVVKHGYVSVTPLHYDLTEYKLLDSLQQHSLDLGDRANL